MLDGRTGNGRSPVGSALCLCQEYLSGARLVWGKVNASLQVAGIIWGHSVSKFGLKDASVGAGVWDSGTCTTIFRDTTFCVTPDSHVISFPLVYTV